MPFGTTQKRLGRNKNNQQGPPKRRHGNLRTKNAVNLNGTGLLGFGVQSPGLVDPEQKLGHGWGKIRRKTGGNKQVIQVMPRVKETHKTKWCSEERARTKTGPETGGTRKGYWVTSGRPARRDRS